jgi:L-alanine-DL-glutamate epimerase-like enolase superfamily enzyme
MKTEVVEANVEFIDRPFLKPLKLSSGPITHLTEARVTVRARTDGKEAVGRGNIFLSDLWAWPDPSKSHAQRDAMMRTFTKKIAADLPSLVPEPRHPLELGLQLHESIVHPEHSSVATMLARAVCASPFDAAIHDAAGIALGRSAFDFYQNDEPLPLADHYLNGNASAAISKTLQPPKKSLDAWFILGFDDPLDNLGQFRCFKLKTLGKDNSADVARTVAVYRAARSAGIARPRLSIDSNEGNANAESVLDYLRRLREADREAFDAVEYLEQPTSRDILTHRNDWREVGKLKPVLLDEGLTSLDLLPQVKADGWSGLCLKTCKGHSFTLVAAAWARENDLLVSMQDLTNPGFSAIHSFLCAARLNVINGVELNSPQFTPDSNREWLPRLSSLFEVRDGVHRLEDVTVAGLGSTL